jgi:hypothetical protein
MYKYYKQVKEGGGDSNKQNVKPIVVHAATVKGGKKSKKKKGVKKWNLERKM